MVVIDTPLPDGCVGEEKIQYAAGTLSGCLTNTSVSLGQYSVENLTILLATNISKEVAANGDLYSGTLGLADDKLTNSNTSTFVSALYAAKQISEPEMGFYLPGGNATDDQAGQMVFGNPSDSQHATSNEPVNLERARPEDGVYVVNLTEVSVGGESVAAQQIAVLDTGSIGIGIPSSISEDIFDKVYGDTTEDHGGRKVDCQSPANTGNDISLDFHFKDKTFSVKYEELVSKPEDDGTCWALIGTYDGVEEADEKWVLGVPYCQL
uniref:Peptidase A1 domain-containing protein n=1 Tax=Kwoniella dejecticola CBS 10117 TaxID=1296121 RepID=A0A1A6A823_9TREE|nr:uncharacterized protein I303_03920 [Kwoniella dejecticola CBS 10117]OBR86200.1 hypothetical protein I303_03920 [Kwoniella dejecticola CBS 10117]